MSQEYAGKDPLDIAAQAEKDLNSLGAKTGAKGGSDSTLESGVDEAVQGKFPGADVTYGSAASGAGDNREIPLSEGGDIDKTTGRPYKARDFEGVGGPEDKQKLYEQEHPGNDDVQSNVRQ